jgi:hypothetical protein
MKPDLPAATKPVTRFARVVFMLAVGFASVAGIQLYILTEHTDHYFAWTIAQPLSAAFLGSVYWSGASLFAIALTERAWSHVRIAVAAVGSFVVLMLITTLLHLDRFHLNAKDIQPLFAAWIWMVVYIVFPALLLLVVIVQRRAPGQDAPRAAPLSGRVRTALGVNALFALLVCAALFLFPKALFSIWPWQLTELTARAVSAGFLVIAAGSYQMIRENAWERDRVGGISYLLFGLLQLLALARYAGSVEWSRPATWVYLLFMGTVVYGGIYLILHTWGPLAQRAALAKQQPPK